MTTNFDWFSDDFEYEIPETKTAKKTKFFMNRYFDSVCNFLFYISLVSLFFYTLRFLISAEGEKVFNTDLNSVLWNFFIVFSLLTVIKKSVETILDIFERFGLMRVNKILDVSYRWGSIIIWTLISLEIISYDRKKLLPIYSTLTKFFQCSLATSFTFTGLAIFLQFFYESFIIKTLKDKIKEVSKTERIISILKNYRYVKDDDSSSSQDNTEDPTCFQVYCCGAPEKVADKEEKAYSNIEDDNNKISWALFKKPEIENIYEAKRLARDCFIKASGDKLEELDYENFAKIFPTTKIAIEAFNYFDENSDQGISKKEFRNTIFRFYIDRINLEKGFHVSKGFVDMIGDIISIMCHGLLILVYLVIFGVSIKDLAALALSSALLINFSLSGMANDLFANIKVLLSHPFDIGDEVIIDDSPYYIKKIGLSSTTMIAENGGIVKFLNSSLSGSKIYNMTKSPEKILAFNFSLSPNTSLDTFLVIKKYVRNYLKDRKFDFYDDFTLKTTSEKTIGIDKLDCTLVLKNKNYKSRTKRFYMRTEFICYINKLLGELEVKIL